MKIKILALALILGLAFTFTANEVYAQKAAKKAAAPKTAKPMKGQIVSFNDLVMGGKGKVTKDEAIKLAEAGNPIVFKVDKKIYFVYNEDGTFAGKKLAKYANNEYVGIIGKAKTVNGINIIIMTMIDSM
jgi:hypothetical protein